MARIPYCEPETAPEGSREVLSKMAGLNIFRALANSPTMFPAFIRLGNAILLKSKLDPILREMAIVRVGILSNAGYEVFQHERISRQVGIPDEKIAALRQSADAEIFDEKERAVLRFTDDVVKNVHASGETYDGCARYLDTNQMIELLITIGYYMMVSRFLETMEVELEGPGKTATVQFGPKGFSRGE
jgi:4-carboxymuconolactone decarboxylase